MMGHRLVSFGGGVSRKGAEGEVQKLCKQCVSQIVSRHL